jgi:hypothetical protein
MNRCSGDGVIKLLQLSETRVHITTARLTTFYEFLPEIFQQLTITAVGMLLCSINDVMTGSTS